MAPLVLYAVRGLGFRSCCLNAANFPAVKIFPAGGCIAMRLPNFFLIFSNPLHLNDASPRKVWP